MSATIVTIEHCDSTIRNGACGNNERLQQQQAKTTNGESVPLLESNGACHSSASSTGVLLRTCCAFAFLFVTMTLNLTVLAIIHERVPRAAAPLPDLGFDLTPFDASALTAAEIIIVIQTLGVACILFLHKHRGVIFRRICLCGGVIYLLRALTMASTQLPVANRLYYCSPQIAHNVSTGEFIGTIGARVFYMTLGMGLSINGQHKYCGDYIYSGHTIILTLCYLIVREYLIPLRLRTFLWKLFNAVVFLLSFSAVVCLSVSRGHYLIDIIIAYFVTTRVFWIYHTLCYNSSLRYKSPTNYLSRVWWFPLFRYFEGGQHVQLRRPCTCAESTQIPRKFEWPLPWPKKCLRVKRCNAQQ